MKSIWMTSVFILVWTGICPGQKIIKSSDFLMYQHGEKMYTIEQLADVFKENPKAYYHYKRYRETQNYAHKAGAITLSMIVGGILLVAIIQEPSDCKQRVCITDLEVLGGFMILLSPIPGIIGISNQISASTHKRKAFNLYNQQYSYLPSGKEEISLSFGNTQHGIGLTLKF